MHRDKEETDATLAQLGKVYHPGTASLLTHAGFVGADLGDGLGQVPVPVERIVGDVQVGIDDQHVEVLSRQG